MRRSRYLVSGFKGKEFREITVEARDKEEAKRFLRDAFDKVGSVERWGEHKDFLGNEFGAEKEITTADFLWRIEKQSLMDILIYQLDTCPKCLGGLEIIVETNKTTRRCKNCTYSIIVSVISVL